MANEAVRELEDAAAEAFGYLADLAKESDRTGAKACADRLAAALRGMDEAPPGGRAFAEKLPMELACTRPIVLVALCHRQRMACKFRPARLTSAGRAKECSPMESEFMRPSHWSSMAAHRMGCPQQ